MSCVRRSILSACLVVWSFGAGCLAAVTCNPEVTMAIADPVVMLEAQPGQPPLANVSCSAAGDPNIEGEPAEELGAWETRLRWDWDADGGDPVFPDQSATPVTYYDPGEYEITVNMIVELRMIDVGGEWVEIGRATDSGTAWVFRIIDTLAEGQHLWWFNGADPGGWVTWIFLIASGTTTGDFIWTVTSGRACVQFGNGSHEYIGHDDNMVLVEAIGASAAEGDVTIMLRYVTDDIADDVGECELTVHMPKYQVEYRAPEHGHGPRYYGYETRLHYKLFDQLEGEVQQPAPNHVLPGNEEWTTEEVDVVQQQHWDRPGEYGYPADNIVPPTFVDSIVVSTDEPNYFVPLPLWPGDPLGNELVDYWGQAWNWGSLTPGEGAQVQNKTLYRFRDHGDVH